MALYKLTRQEDGVNTGYHRILYLMIMPNKRNSINVVSYVDDAARADEKNNIITQPYKKSVSYEFPYDEEMNIVKAYEYLKTRPEFEGATDI